MKKTWLIIVGLVMVLAVIGFAGCGNPDTINGEEGNLRINLNSQQEGIWVSGQGKVSTVPDIA
ncbi:hypothetical protein ACFLVE_02215, partial [Chloroflexota bacterium]